MIKITATAISQLLAFFPMDPSPRNPAAGLATAMMHLRDVKSRRFPCGREPDYEALILGCGPQQVKERAMVRRIEPIESGNGVLLNAFDNRLGI
jgi:hypothetical protein